MGKKSKKLKEAGDIQPSIPSEHVPEIIKPKKKSKHNSDLDTDNNILASEDMNTDCEQLKKFEEHELQTSIHVKKKLKKKRHLIEEQVPGKETELTNVNDNTEKKKKKKGKLLNVEEIKEDIDQFYNETVDQNKKVYKKQKTNHVSIGDEKPDNQSNIMVEPKGQKKKSKRKTGNAVLNQEESQVTEEDIDRFCEELDEEDNKQYEDWVKLIEATLPPSRAKN